MAYTDFTVERHDLKKEIGVNYKFIFPDRRPGEAQVLLKVLEKYKRAPYYETLLEAGLDPEDTIAHLSDFSPNGLLYIEEYMRKGVGSKALEIITGDVTECDAKLMLVYADTHSLKDFLQKKHGFEPLHRNFLYKKL